MKIYVNRKPIEGPWGGGVKTLAACIQAFKAAKHEVTFTLTSDVDVVFCVDPRKGSEKDQLGFDEIADFIVKNASASKRIKLVQRVGDIGSHGKPELTKLVVQSTQFSDCVIFTSQWALDQVERLGRTMNVVHQNQWHIVRNAPLSMFHESKHVKATLPVNISFVTHHWSMNEKKGFTFYSQFQNWAKENGHTFTFIGRKPEGCNLHVLSPMTAKELTAELPKYDVYVTASEAEAGANHVLEAVACGLPIIFSTAGGSIPEYCKNFGVPFNGTVESFASALKDLRGDLKRVKKSIISYDRTVDDVAQVYLSVVEGVLRNA